MKVELMELDGFNHGNAYIPALYLGMFSRSKRTVGQADMTLALLGQNLYKYLGII